MVLHANEKVFLVIICLAALTKIVTSESLLCYQCKSDIDQSCLKNPPPSYPCQASELATCRIIRYLDINKKLVKLVRDCATHGTSSGCLPPDSKNQTKCFETCDTDRCNSSRNNSLEIISALLSFISLIVFSL